MTVSAALEYIKLVNRYMDEGYTDGLPVIPPYPEAVEAMVAASGRKADEVLGHIPPRNNPLSIQTAAINAVMAGCLPEYMPVIIAAMEAMLDPEFNLVSPACTTKGVAPLVVVNGPIRRQLNINCKGGLFGPGFRANATIGRALRLILINVGGAKAQVLDKSTFGHPGKYTYVIGEDEEGSPWTPFHVDYGFNPEDSTVTVIACDGPKLVTNFNSGAEGILLQIAETAAISGYKDDVVVILGPEHRDTLVEAGWTKRSIQEFLYEHIGRRAGELKRINSRSVQETDPDDRFIHLVKSPEEIKVICAGGGAGRMSVVIDGFALHKYCKWQMRKIEVPH